MKANPDLFDTEGEKTAEKPDLITLLKEYVEIRLEMGRLTVLERVTITLANLFTDGFVLFMLILVCLFGSVALAFYLGTVLDSTAGGFGIVTLIYLGLAILMYFTKDRVVEKYLINFMIKRITNKKEDGKKLQ